MRRFLFHVALVIAVACWGSTTILADESAPVGSKDKPSTKTKANRGKPAAKEKETQPVKQIEMFAAMDEGLISVEYIGKDATQANLIFRNRGDAPLDVALPNVFGAVPVLQQGMGMGGMGGGGMGGMGGGQGMGGGMGGMGGGGMGGMGGMGGGGMGGRGGMGMGGMMRVEPDRPRKLTVPTVCLEHGKADPNPRMKYKVVRLSEVNPSPEINELCKAMARGQVSQNVAQAAAWHIANGLSWRELAAKPRVVSQYTGIEYYFSPAEIQNALRLTSFVTIAAENAAQSESPGERAVSSGEQALFESPGERESK